MTTASTGTRRRASVGSFAQLLLLAVIAGAGALMYLAKDFTLASAMRGTGTVAPFGKPRLMLSPVAGTVSTQALQNGPVVDQGQLLFRIETAEETADADALRSKDRAVRAMIDRLEAVVGGAEDIVFSDDLVGTAAAAQEQETFDEQKVSLVQQLQVFRDTAAKNRLEITEQKAAAVRFKQARDLAKQELDVIAPLVSRGVAPKLESLRLQQKVQELEAKRESATLTIPRLEASLQESERRLKETVTAFRADARKDLSEKNAELAAVQQALADSTGRVVTTEVRAPMRGTVGRAAAGDVRAGQVLAEIAPLMEALFVDVKLPASESATLRPNERAIVNVGSANIPSVLVDVGRNTNVDPQGQRFRQVSLRINADTAGFEQLTTAGLGVGVIVETRLPVLDYILDAIAVARGGALPWD